MAGRRSPSVGTGVGRLIAVLDTREAADGRDRGARRGRRRPRGDRAVLGPGGGRRLRPDRARHGLLGVLYRILEFSWADQAPDFAWYDAAIREGRIVMSVRVRGQRHVAHARAVIEEHGGHFINHFGWFETQELARWKGREPDVPGFLRR